MGQAERTIFGCPVLSGSLRPSFSIYDAGNGSRRPRTLYFFHVTCNFVRVVRNFVRVVHYFVCVLLYSACVIRDFAYVACHRRIGFRGIWVENDSA
jgi:hypothetical protein